MFSVKPFSTITSPVTKPVFSTLAQSARMTAMAQLPAAAASRSAEQSVPLAARILSQHQVVSVLAQAPRHVIFSPQSDTKIADSEPMTAHFLGHSSPVQTALRQSLSSSVRWHQSEQADQIPPTELAVQLAPAVRDESIDEVSALLIDQLAAFDSLPKNAQLEFDILSDCSWTEAAKAFLAIASDSVSVADFAGKLQIDKSRHWLNLIPENDRSLALFLKIIPLAWPLHLVPELLRENSQICLLALKHNVDNWSFVPLVLRASPDFRLAAVKLNGLVLCQMVNSFDPSIALCRAAVSQNPAAICALSPQYLANDKRLLRVAAAFYRLPIGDSFGFMPGAAQKMSHAQKVKILAMQAARVAELSSSAAYLQLPTKV